ncbi:hypothetical protein [Enterococcus sp. AZ103]|uniref:hypothetical protein n=1 Tax=Enterococcus sp. AZ103 TaxID=2774628 RepID=UPI003F263B3F
MVNESDNDTEKTSDEGKNEKDKDSDNYNLGHILQLGTTTGIIISIAMFYFGIPSSTPNYKFITISVVLLIFLFCRLTYVTGLDLGGLKFQKNSDISKLEHAKVILLYFLIYIFISVVVTLFIHFFLSELISQMVDIFNRL